MQENDTVKKQTHIRLHDRDGFVCGIDINQPVEVVIDHIMKLRTGDI